MRKKPHVPFQTKFPNADVLAVRLLERMLAFDPTHRPTAEEVRGGGTQGFGLRCTVCGGGEGGWPVVVGGEIMGELARGRVSA